MTDTVIRCPYCVFFDEFRPMVALQDGRFVCENCGHKANGKFECSCQKCVRLRAHQTRYVA